MSRRASNEERSSSPNLPHCLREAQPFFAEGTLVPDKDDPTKINISADLLLPQQRHLRIRVDLRANISDVIMEQSGQSGSASLPQESPQPQMTPSKESDVNKTVEVATGTIDQPLNTTKTDRHVSWYPNDVRRRLEFTSSTSLSYGPGSEQPQSSSTPITYDKSPSTLSTGTAASVPTTSEPTLPEQSATASSLASQSSTATTDSGAVRGHRRLQKAIRAGRVTVRRRKKSRGRGLQSDLIFPVHIIGRYLRDGGYTGNQCRKTAKLALTAALETITGDLLEIAGEKTKEDNRIRILPRDIKDAVVDDDEFRQLLRDVHIPLDPPPQ